MKHWIAAFNGWMALILITLCLTGCGTTKVQEINYPPIFILEQELSCLSAGTKRQLVAHNCKVDYDPKVCPPERKPK